MLFVSPTTFWPVVAGASTSIEKWVTSAARELAGVGDSITSRTFDAQASYSTCFTPGQNCQGLLVREIGKAKSRILVQAYSFTSAPIAKALVEAKRRGVVVKVILDKSQRNEKYTGATFLRNAGIPVVIDEKPAIAHSKIMIFDHSAVLTGSFNFSKAAQEKNAENIILIKGDEALVNDYENNWNTRWGVSVPYQGG